MISGIPGFDESYLPRWIGYAFGSLLLLNHFLGSDSATVTTAQLVRFFHFIHSLYLNFEINLHTMLINYNHSYV